MQPGVWNKITNDHSVNTMTFTDPDRFRVLRNNKQDISQASDYELDARIDPDDSFYHDNLTDSAEYLREWHYT